MPLVSRVAVWPSCASLAVLVEVKTPTPCAVAARQPARTNVITKPKEIELRCFIYPQCEIGRQNLSANTMILSDYVHPICGYNRGVELKAWDSIIKADTSCCFPMRLRKRPNSKIKNALGSFDIPWALLAIS